MAGNQGDDDLDYGEEADEIQVTNPEKLKNDQFKDQILSNTNNQPEEEEEEDEQPPQIDYTPSFFSQRFASDLLKGGQSQELEDIENVNAQNRPNNSLFVRMHNEESTDCKLNVNTI